MTPLPKESVNFLRHLKVYTPYEQDCFRIIVITVTRKIYSLSKFGHSFCIYLIILV